jgi:hypothetical protein
LKEPQLETTGGPLAVEHPEWALTRTSRSGFRLQTPGRPAIRVEAAEGGWSIEGAEPGRAWTLRRGGGGGAIGFVLAGADGSELGRTMPLVGSEADDGVRFLLLGDGRLFRLLGRGPRESGLDLTGWEVPGSYLGADPTPAGWSLNATPAGAGLGDVRVPAILMAAELLDAESRLKPAEP